MPSELSAQDLAVKSTDVAKRSNIEQTGIVLGLQSIMNPRKIMQFINAEKKAVIGSASTRRRRTLSATPNPLSRSPDDKQILENEESVINTAEMPQYMALTMDPKIPISARFQGALAVMTHLLRVADERLVLIETMSVETDELKHQLREAERKLLNAPEKQLVDRLREKSKTLKNKGVEYRREINRLAAEKKNLGTSHERLQDDYRKLKMEKDKSDREFNNKRIKFEKEQERMQKDMMDMKRSLEEKAETEKKLMENQTRLNDDLFRLDWLHRCREAEAAETKDELGKEAEEHQQTLAKLAAADAQINEAAEILARVQEREASLSDRLKEAATELEERHAANDELVKDRKKLEDTVKDLRSQLEQEQANHARLEKEKEAREQWIKELEEEVKHVSDCAQERETSLSDGLKEAAAELEERDAANDELVKGRKKLEDTLKDVQSQLEQEKANLDRLEKEKQAREQRIKELEEEVKHDSERIQKLKTDRKSMEDKLAEFQRQLESAGDNETDLHRQQTTLRSTIAELEQKLEQESEVAVMIDEEIQTDPTTPIIHSQLLPLARTAFGLGLSLATESPRASLIALGPLARRVSISSIPMEESVLDID